MRIQFKTIRWVFRALVCVYCFITLSLIAFMSEHVSFEGWIRYSLRWEVFSLPAFVVAAMTARLYVSIVLQSKTAGASSSNDPVHIGRHQSVWSTAIAWVLKLNCRTILVVALLTVQVGCLMIFLLRWMDIYVDLKYLVSDLREDQLHLQSVGYFLADTQVIVSVLAVLASGMVARRTEPG